MFRRFLRRLVRYVLREALEHLEERKRKVSES